MCVVCLVPHLATDRKQNFFLFVVSVVCVCAGEEGEWLLVIKKLNRTVSTFGFRTESTPYRVWRMKKKWVVKSLSASDDFYITTVRTYLPRI